MSTTSPYLPLTRGDRPSPLVGRVRIPHVTLHGIEHKSCAHCGTLKPLDQFTKDVQRLDGLASYCRSCQAIRR